MRRSVHDPGEVEHVGCPDVYCCECECLTCKRAWFAMSRPTAAACPVHGSDPEGSPVQNSTLSAPKRDEPYARRVMNSRLFSRVQVAFWVAYIVLQIFTGWLAYRWLPNESYNEHKHELIESNEEEDGNDRTGEVADVWRDRQTGQTYWREMFEQHRRDEARRVAIAWFSYGLIGCSVFAFSSVAAGRSSFVAAFTRALLVDFAIAAFTWIRI